MFRAKRDGPDFHGAKAYMNVYNPKVEMYQVSMGLIWLEGGNTILVSGSKFNYNGWMDFQFTRWI